MKTVSNGCFLDAVVNIQHDGIFCRNFFFFFFFFFFVAVNAAVNELGVAKITRLTGLCIHNSRFLLETVGTWWTLPWAFTCLVRPPTYLYTLQQMVYAEDSVSYSLTDFMTACGFCTLLSINRHRSICEVGVRNFNIFTFLNCSFFQV